MKISDPTARPVTGDTGLAPRLPVLEGHALGIVSNQWRSIDVMASHFERIAREMYQVREVIQAVNPDLFNPTPEDVLGGLVDRADAAIVGIGQ